MDFAPDYHQFESVLRNERPERLPLYEHNISVGVMETILGTSFAELMTGDAADRLQYAREYCRFWKEMTYDVISLEACITEAIPEHGALMGGHPGPIQDGEDFEAYDFDGLVVRFWEQYEPLFDAMKEALPAGMKFIGGVGNGAFEVSEDLVGYEYLAYLQADEPDVFAALYTTIGDVMVAIWSRFLDKYGDMYVAGRFGDDLGFKTATLLAPETLRTHVIPQYKRVIDLVHGAGKPFVLHSCGAIFEVMDDLIAAGIDAKHSNEDAVAPYDTWIEKYAGRIALLGGIDVDCLCQRSPEAIRERVIEDGRRFRATANGYALGSGNSIPGYVPTDGYLAMVDGVKALRAESC